MTEEGTKRVSARNLRRWLALPLAAGFALALAAPAQATFPGDNGKIVFEDDLFGTTGDIWVVNPDGSGLEQLTTDDQGNGNAEWSPDGQRIAFDKRIENTPRLHTMNADGTGVTPVGAAPGIRGSRPAWSPDGTTLVFDNLTSLLTVNADGTGIAILVTGSSDSQYGGADWSPDGTTVAFRWFQNDEGTFRRGIGVVDVATGTVTFLAGGPDDPNNTDFYASPEWSPDGSLIYYSRGQGPSGNSEMDLWSVEPDGSNPTNITNSVPDESQPTPAPDGTRIAFGGDPNFVSSGGTLSLMDPDGTDGAAIPGGITAYYFDWQPIPPDPQLEPIQIAKSTTSAGVAGHWKWNVAKWTTSPLWAEIYKARPYHYKVLVESHGFEVTSAEVISRITLTNPNDVEINGTLNDVLPGFSCIPINASLSLPGLINIDANSTDIYNVRCTRSGDPGATVTNTASFTPVGVDLDPVSANATANIDRTPPAGSPGEEVVVKDPMYKKGEKVLRRFNALNGPTKGIASYSSVLGLPSRTGIAWCHNISNTASIYDAASGERAGKSNKVTVRICKPPDFYSRHDKKNPAPKPKAPLPPKAPKAKDGTPKVSKVLGGPKYISKSYRTRTRTRISAPRRVYRGKLVKIRVITRNLTKKRAYGVVVKAKLPRGMKLTMKPRNVHLGKGNTVWWTTKAIGPRKRIVRTLKVVPIRTGRNRMIAVFCRPQRAPLR